MLTKKDIAKDWLPRYTGMEADEFGDYILLTNFHEYIEKFCTRFHCKMHGRGSPMQAATNSQGLSMVNFGIGPANMATVMDLLTACNPKGVLFLGKCGGLKASTEIGHFILPIGAIRGDGASDNYMPREVPALPSFKLHKFVSEKLVQRDIDYRTGVIYTTNRRVWEWDVKFKEYLQSVSAIGIDMETATLFVTGHTDQIARGALLLVSDMPMLENGIKTRESDKKVSREFVDLHIEIGIEAMTEIGQKGEKIKHFSY